MGAFRRRIQKRICDLRSYGFFPTRKTENPKKGSFTRTTSCARAHCEKKNNGKKQQTDPRGEDRKEKQHKLRMKYTKCINSFETQTK